MTDKEQILEALNLYLESGRQAKSEIMKPMTHEYATMYWAEDGVITGGHIQELFDRIDGRDPSPDVTHEIHALDISHTTATVRVELDNWGGKKFSDQLSFIKTDEGWKLIHKIFFHHKG